jgi:hypothetical protein
MSEATAQEFVLELATLDALIGYMGRALKDASYKDPFTRGYSHAYSDVAHIRSVLWFDRRRTDPELVAAHRIDWDALKAAPATNGYDLGPIGTGEQVQDFPLILATIDAVLGYFERSLKGANFGDPYVSGYAKAHSHVAHIRQEMMRQLRTLDPVTAARCGVDWDRIETQPDLGKHRIDPQALLQDRG